MTLAAWFHDLGPFAIRFTDSLGVRWYGLSYVAGFIIAYLALRALSRRNLALIPYERVPDAMLWLVVGVMAGGRLGYILAYEPHLLVSFSPSFPFWSALALNKGGMASHGGIAGVILACFRIAQGWKDDQGRIQGRCNPMHVMDLTALLCPIGLMLGRIANFVNGELLGRIAAMPGSPAPWWSVKFPQEVLTGHDPARTLQQTNPTLHAAREEALARIAQPFRTPERPFEAAYERVLETIHAGGARGRELAENLAPWISARHPSQLYQAAAEGLILGGTLLFIWRRPRRPGIVGAWFLLLYGVLRIITELFRLPDDHLATPTIAGLSRGQWLSVIMILVGAAALVILARRPAPKLGGWLTGPPAP